ncbi:MAG: phosphatase PAP2 family protein [Bacteroidetes bacterium]|nr:phosphatase PAP2 family protein [Bacteroidota bacterium]
MKNKHRNKRVAILCHIVMAVVVLPYVLLYPKNVSMLFINSHHTPWLDTVMYHITRLPELAFIVFVFILGLFAERRQFLAIVVAMSLSGLSILLFKNVLFPDFDRPFQWLNANQVNFHHVPGIRLHSNGSFPSGHTIAAFCSLALVGFVSKKGWLQALLFIVACSAAYSRVYAAQHYLMDVYAGALIGFFYAFLFTWLFEKWFTTPVWLKPLIKFS